mmetsp:Transcript_17406/g.27720  ORF Transcript_17406/g.27720 Transcript_17406/m.27720 type:complete len:140 (-) Transcript_17406:999-1418(-)
MKIETKIEIEGEIDIEVEIATPPAAVLPSAVPSYSIAMADLSSKRRRTGWATEVLSHRKVAKVILHAVWETEWSSEAMAKPALAKPTLKIETNTKNHPNPPGLRGGAKVFRTGRPRAGVKVLDLQYNIKHNSNLPPGLF